MRNALVGTSGFHDAALNVSQVGKRLGYSFPSCFNRSVPLGWGGEKRHQGLGQCSAPKH
jgi:hypothetical protein